MIFVVNGETTASTLRGDHIAEALGAKVFFADLGSTRNTDVVFVKDADRGLVLDAKDRNCRIILDVIDFFSYKNRECRFSDLVDILIVPNRSCIAWYTERFPQARYAVIPHQWDYRIKGQAQHYRYSPGYIGKHFNLTVPMDWGGTNIFQSTQHLEAAPLFNLHLALQRRDEKIAMLKPATKISTAAAVGANVLTYRDPSAVELLGPDYPFYVDIDPMDAIRMVREAFGGRDWKLGREIMKEVKERTSLMAIAELYRHIEDSSFLVDALAKELAA